MELIKYRKTLDVHKSGIQFMLQGFETADNLSRVIEISLMSGGDTFDFPSERIAAMMYVTTPSATQPSINACTIKDNKVIYDVLPITEEGITTMQIKLIETSPEGAKRILASPKFAVEVTKSNVDDEGAMQTTTFTALEDAVAIAKGAYEQRLIKVDVDDECIFRAYYADGTVYETDAINESLLKGDSGLAKYYADAAKSSAIEAKEDGDHATDLLTETRKHGVYTTFDVDFETGELMYASPSYEFSIDTESGELNATGKEYSLEEELEGRAISEIATEVASLIGDSLNGGVSQVSIEDQMSEYLPKSGGTLTGSLGVGGGKGILSANEEYSILEANKDADNARQIRISNPTTEAIPLSDAVKFSNIVDGVKTDFNLFGEHNIGSLISGMALGQIEIGTFKGIGLEAINSGILPSIEFKKITPKVVILLEHDGCIFFSPDLAYGFGRRGWYKLTYHQFWEGKKLSYRCASYSSTPGSTTYPVNDLSALEYSDLENFLAMKEITYLYIGIGGEN